MKISKSYTLEQDIVKFIKKMQGDMEISSASALVERVFLSIMLTGSFTVPSLKMQPINEVPEIKQEEVIVTEEKSQKTSGRKRPDTSNIKKDYKVFQDKNKDEDKTVG